MIFCNVLIGVQQYSSNSPTNFLGNLHIFEQVWHRFNICYLMMKWWVNEIELRNFTQNLNEKLYKPIFAKKIRPKYFQNSLMVLSYFCIDVSENLIVSSNFFRPKSPLKFRESHQSQRHTKKFVPSSFFNQFLYQKTLVIYFESCKESELVNSILSKGNLSLTY